jgi:hypothetical protein
MIIIKMQGGLCNQLFQWAFGRSLSKRFGIKDYYDISFYTSGANRAGYTDAREFCLPDLLNIKIPILTQDVIDQFHSKAHRDGAQKFIQEPSNGSFIQIEYDKKFFYYFDGYWQNEKYIKDYRSEIISYLNLDLNHNLDFTDSCSLHVRRGDYLKSNGYHPVLDIVYYQKALEIIKPKGNLFVFSDDIAWCKQNFEFENMIFMENNSNIDDLKLMAMCHNNIIANSSFSWMGAWLNQNPQKKVVSPKVWYGNNVDYQTVRPEEWIVI